MTRLRWSGFLLAVISLASAACSGASDEAEEQSDATPTTDVVATEGEPVSGGSLVFGINAEPGDLNPLTAQAALQGHFALSAIYDALGSVGEDGLVHPLLATSIEANEAGDLWTIGVPEGVTFHDGSELTAEIVAENLNARRAGPTGNIQLGPMDTAEAVDAMTVEVTMREPWGAFDYLLTQQAGYVVSRSMLDGETDQVVGTGPYRLVEQVPDSHTTFERNEDYWRTDDAGRRLPYLDDLEFRIMSEPTTRRAALESGSTDLMFTITMEIVDELRASGDWKVAIDDRVEETLVVLNASRPPLDDPRVREAVIRSVDRQVVNEAAFEGLLDVAAGPFRPGEFGYEEDTGYPETDVAAARALVEAYTADTGEAPSFKLSIITGPEAQAISQTLIEMWDAVGIDADIDVAEQGTFITSLVFGEKEAALMSNFGFADPDFHYLFFHSSNAFPPGEGIGTNFTYTINEELDAVMDLGRSSTDREERRQAYAESVRLYNGEFSVVFLTHRVVALVGADHVNGLAAAEGPGFGRVDTQPWLAELWVDPAG